jgi:hypothetical protein
MLVLEFDVLQEFSIESKTSGWSSSSTLWEDLEARYKSSNEVNMTPRSPRNNPWRRKTPRTWTENAESCGTRSSIQTMEKLMSRAHMQKGEHSRRFGKHHPWRRPRSGSKWAQACQPRLVGPAHFVAHSCPPLTKMPLRLFIVPLPRDMHQLIRHSSPRIREERDTILDRRGSR